MRREFMLRTPRLVLRELGDGDAAFMLELLNDAAWLRHIGDRGVRTLEGAREYVRARIVSMYERLGFGLWMVEGRADGRPMGICGLVKRDALEEVDLGFAFMPAFRGQGYAYESALAVRDHAADVLGLRRLLAITSPANRDSTRLLGRLAFVFEREMPWGDDAGDRVQVYAYEAPPGQRP